MIEQEKQILKSVFGYDGFVSLQEEVIRSVLQGRDTLVVMPTGGGKSLCYQIPALVLGGLTIVVSPLISLMKDQVDQLSELNVPAVLLNSSLSSRDYRHNVERLREGEARLLYVAPETLLKANILTLLDSLSVTCLAIDEAHCISEWGPDFRPEYRRLREVRVRFPRAVCIALTATATPRVRQDIKTCLDFDDSCEFIASFNRENLFLQVVPKANPFRQTTEFLKRFPGESGIIYCLTRKQVEDLCAALQSEGFSVCPYHAGMPETQRNENQERFVRDEVRIIVATIAFGMGIDKSNIRFVIHYDLPKSIESYYQEIGRSGRDGMRADCLLLFSRGDAFKIKSFIDKKEGDEKRAAKQQLNGMIDFAESCTCRRIPLLNYFGETFPEEKCGMCDNCLAGEKEMRDATIPAQKFLSCVKRTGECFGMAHIIDVLRGSKASKVLRHKHDALSTYGIGKEFSREQWQQLARQFLHKDLMVQDPKFGGLALTPKAWDVFKGRELVFCRLDDFDETMKPTEEAPQKVALSYDRQLFELLRQKRKELADAANLPPYIIFSDKTLAEMATIFPQNRDGLLRTHGVGTVKLEKYGTAFLEIIRNYCRDHSIERPIHRPMGSLPKSLKPDTRKRHHIIGEAFRSGRSVEELIKAFGIKQSTVLDHLSKYALEGYPLPSEGLLSLLTLTDHQQKRAMEAFEHLGPHLLRPVFDALNEEVGYEDLKIIRLYYLSQYPLASQTQDVVPQEKPYSKEIICLANSRKYSGCCVAGKEWMEGRIGGWIRPVSQGETGELSTDGIIMQNGNVPKLLDIITVFLKGEDSHAYQSENHLLAQGRWAWKGTLPRSQVPNLCDEVDRLWVNGYHSFNGLNDRMPVEWVRENLLSSLLFIRPDSLGIIVEEGSKGLKKIRAKFKYMGETYALTVTDPVVEAQYLTRDNSHYPVEHSQTYITVSISEPFEGFCYKLVAGIIVGDC